MQDQEDTAKKRAIISAAAGRIAAKQQGVIEDFETSISEKIEISPPVNIQSIRDFLIEDD